MPRWLDREFVWVQNPTSSPSPPNRKPPPQPNSMRLRWSRATPRSEEHTSELQSRSDLVCRLLLEKKKTHRERQHEHADGRGRRQHLERVQRDAGHGARPARAQQVHVVAAGDERREKPGGGALDAAVEDEGPRDDQELQRPLPARARSTSGKSAARAAAKL